MHSTRQAVRNTIRIARSHPGFVAVLVFTLSVGIGSTTAALNVAAGVLLTPLPVADDSRLLLITKRLASGPTNVPFSYAEMTAWGEAAQTLEAVAGVQYDGAWPWPAQFRDRVLPVTGTTVSGNFFSVLGAQPMYGRLLTAEDGRPGAEAVAVLGYGLWRRQFGGDPGIVGQTIRLNGKAATIIGICPPGFAFPKGADVWQPLVTTPDAVNEGWFNLVARLEPGATSAQALEESAALLERHRSITPGRPLVLRSGVVPLKDAIVGDVRPVMRLFVIAAILLFLVGCLNVMNLLLVRGAAREAEMSLCAALGASRGRLVRQLLAETMVLAAAGGVLGAAIAFSLQRALLAAAPAGLPRQDQIVFDGRALALAILASLTGVLLAGVAPALWTARRSLFSRLHDPSRSGSAGTRGQLGRQFLVASQLGFALVVTVAAALLVRNLQQLQAAALGFSVEGLTVVQAPLVGPQYADPERRQRLFDQLVARMEASPGIAAATPVLLRPFTGGDGWDATFTVEGQRPEEAAANPGLHLEAVLPNYFSTMGSPLVRGRGFVEGDRKGSTPVVIVSDSLSRRAWPGSSALGKRLKFGGPADPTPWMTVVGIVGDLRYRDLKAPPPAVYLPLRQASFPPRFLIVRAGVAEAPVLALTQRSLSEIDPGEPVSEAASVKDLLASELAAPRFQMSALLLFASLAVLLAGVGVFGVLGAFVAQRSREVGLRIALGANLSRIRWLVLSRVGWPAALGLSAGTFAAFAAGPLLRPLLFQVDVLDPRAFAAGCGVLTLATLLSALVPLRRAVRVDPATLLRSQ